MWAIFYKPKHDLRESDICFRKPSRAPSGGSDRQLWREWAIVFCTRGSKHVTCFPRSCFRGDGENTSVPLVFAPNMSYEAQKMDVEVWQQI